MNGALFFVTFWSIFLMLQLFRVDNANEYLLYCRQLAMTNCIKVKMKRLGISRPFSGKRRCYYETKTYNKRFFELCI